MVLESLGMVRTEAYLRDLCDCNPYSMLIRGISESVKLVSAAKALGFNATKHKMDLDELASEIERGLFPIVNLMTRLSAEGPRTEHAVVVIEVTREHVSVNDPWRSEYTYTRDDFAREWSDAYGVTVLIE